jgi:hypothetical protein
MPPVCSNNVCRKRSSLTPKRAATPWQVPHRIDRGLRHRDIAALVNDRAVDLQPFEPDRVANFRQR